MSKVLVRGVNAPDNAEVLSDSEFIDVCYNTMIDVALSLKDCTETGEVLDALSDILELSNAVLQKENISAANLFAHAAERRSQEGTFMDKKAVNKEQ